MTGYEFFKFMHVVGAIAWLGGGIGLTIYAWRLRVAQEYESLLIMQHRGEDLGKYLFMPAGLLTIGFGILMVATEAFLSFTDLWILIGFGGIAVSGYAEMGIAAPAGKKFVVAAAEHGPGSPEAAAHAARSARGNLLDVAALLVVVWAMVAKPLL
jgi:uncharacterized membrane protein